MILVLLLLSLVGCGTTAIRIPLDVTPLSSNHATVIVWMDQKPQLINDDVRIFVDGVEVGTITAKEPLKFEAAPGAHKIYGQLSFGIRRQIDITLKPGEVSFYRVYVKHGMWIFSVYLVPAEPSTHYDSVIVGRN